MFANPHGVEVLPKPLFAMLQTARGGRARRVAEAGRPAPLAGEGEQLKELREHVAGDPFKRIAWKASARRGQLLVREMEREERDIAWLVLDASVELWAGAHGSAPLDVAIDELGGVAARHIAKGDRVGLVVFASRVRTWLAAGHRPAPGVEDHGGARQRREHGRQRPLRARRGGDRGSAWPSTSAARPARRSPTFRAATSTRSRSRAEAMRSRAPFAPRLPHGIDAARAALPALPRVLRRRGSAARRGRARDAPTASCAASSRSSRARRTRRSARASCTSGRRRRAPRATWMRRATKAEGTTRRGPLDDAFLRAGPHVSRRAVAPPSRTSCSRRFASACAPRSRVRSARCARWACAPKNVEVAPAWRRARGANDERCARRAPPHRPRAEEELRAELPRLAAHGRCDRRGVHPRLRGGACPRARARRGHRSAHPRPRGARPLGRRGRARPRSRPGARRGAGGSPPGTRARSSRETRRPSTRASSWAPPIQTRRACSAATSPTRSPVGCSSARSPTPTTSSASCSWFSSRSPIASPPSPARRRTAR